MVNVGPKPLAIVRFGSLATACAGSFTIVRFGSLATVCVGSLAICLRLVLLYRLRRFFRGRGGPLFRDRFYRLIWGTRCRFLRNHLNHVVRFLLIVTRKIQRRRSQRLRMTGALEMTRSDAVANAQRAGRFPTKARLCRESCR